MKFYLSVLHVCYSDWLWYRRGSFVIPKSVKIINLAQMCSSFRFSFTSASAHKEQGEQEIMDDELQGNKLTKWIKESRFWIGRHWMRRWLISLTVSNHRLRWGWGLVNSLSCLYTTVRIEDRSAPWIATHCWPSNMIGDETHKSLPSFVPIDGDCRLILGLDAAYAFRWHPRFQPTPKASAPFRVGYGTRLSSRKSQRGWTWLNHCCRRRWKNVGGCSMLEHYLVSLLELGPSQFIPKIH